MVIDDNKLKFFLRVCLAVDGLKTFFKTLSVVFDRDGDGYFGESGWHNKLANYNIIGY